MAQSPAVVWCPHCEEWTNARSINASDHGETNYRQYEREGIRFHKRYRECQECSEAFFTTEITDDDFWDLLRDRQLLAEANAKLDGVRKGLRAKPK